MKPERNPFPVPGDVVDIAGLTLLVSHLNTDMDSYHNGDPATMQVTAYMIEVTAGIADGDLL